MKVKHIVFVWVSFMCCNLILLPASSKPAAAGRRTVAAAAPAPSFTSSASVVFLSCTQRLQYITQIV